MSYISKTKNAEAYVCPCCKRPLPIASFYLRTKPSGYTFREVHACLDCRGWVNNGEGVHKHVAVTWINTCLECGNVYLGRIDKEYCSAVCGGKARHRRNYVPAPPRQLPLLSSCAKCGSFGSKYNGSSWCKECDKECSRERGARLKIENPEAHAASLARLRAYREENPRVSGGRPYRRGDNLTKPQWDIMLEVWGGCAYCGVSDVELVRDHVVPYSNGGTLSVDNVVPACANCNGHEGKWDKDMRDWLNDECLYESVLMGIGDAEYAGVV